MKSLSKSPMNSLSKSPMNSLDEDLEIDWKPFFSYSGLEKVIEATVKKKVGDRAQSFLGKLLNT